MDVLGVSVRFVRMLVGMEIKDCVVLVVQLCKVREGFVRLRIPVLYVHQFLPTQTVLIMRRVPYNKLFSTKPHAQIVQSQLANAKNAKIPQLALLSLDSVTPVL